MDSSQRAEFDTSMQVLFGAWNRTYSPGLQEGYWKGLAKMALSDLGRCIDRALESFSERPDMKIPTVGDLWAIKRTLRARPETKMAAEESAWHGDSWDMAANRHLLAYLMRQAVTKTAPQYTPAMTAILVREKNAWAQDMREEGRTVDIETQQGAWDWRMSRASGDLSKLIPR